MSENTPPMRLGDVELIDTYAEAFTMTAARLVITAASPHWAAIAAQTVSGYGTSVIGCDAEVGIEAALDESETPDGRPGASVLAFAFSREALEKALVNRVGQCVMTCPTTACYNGIEPLDNPIVIGGKLRYFGDGWQISKRLVHRRLWRIPVMDGEFTCEETFGTTKGVAGGNIIILGRSHENALNAATNAVAAIRQLRDVILPFPGGIARSGSKVGSKYKALRASSNEAFAPTLRGLVPSQLPEEVACAYEIVIDGLTADAVDRAMAAGMAAAASDDIVALKAGNYGGKLGKHHFHLHDIARRHNLTRQ